MADSSFGAVRLDMELERWFWPPGCEREAIAQPLVEIGRNVGVVVPEAQFAQDHPFRLTSVAFSKPSDPGLCEAILGMLRASGARVTVNNLWVLGWLGDYDKLAMTRRVMMQVYGLDIEVDREAVLYVGDLTNDGPMFNFFRHTVGVSTVIDCLPRRFRGASSMDHARSWRGRVRRGGGCRTAVARSTLG